jgi:L-iditol 2-dehydrogenase
MWAYALSAPSQLVRIESDQPSARDLRPGEVLLRTLVGGICGSDLPHFRGHYLPSHNSSTRLGPPGFPLHEIVGEVVATNHPDHAAGDRVVGWASAFDGLAQYVVSDGDGLHCFDQKLDPTAAVVLQPLACVIHAARRFDASQRSVAVIGLGSIGLLFTHVLKAYGAARVIGIDEVDRSDVASYFGIDTFVHESSVRWSGRLLAEARPGLVVEAVGHQVSTLQHALIAAAEGGTVFYFGLPDDEVYPMHIGEIMRKNLTLMGGGTRERRSMLALADEYLQAHPHLPDDLVTHVMPVTRVQDAFKLAGRPATGRHKVLLTMT